MLVAMLTLALGVFFILMSLNLAVVSLPASILAMCLGLTAIFFGFQLMGGERRR